MSNNNTLRATLERFEPIPEGEWKFFSAQCGEQEVRKHSFFLRAGEGAGRIGFVKYGLLRAYYNVEDETQCTRNFCAESSFAADYASAVANEAALINLEALEDSKLIYFEYEFLKQCFERHPVWERLARKLVERYFIIRERREFQLLALDAKARYQAFLNEFADIVPRLTQVHIASYLGITPVFLNKLINKK